MENNDNLEMVLVVVEGGNRLLAFDLLLTVVSTPNSHSRSNGTSIAFAQKQTDGEEKSDDREENDITPLCNQSALKSCPNGGCSSMMKTNCQWDSFS